MKINKREIQQNLQNIFNKNYNFVKNKTLDDVINHYIKETNQYYIGMGITNYLDDEEVIELKQALRNKELRNAFEDVKNFNVDDQIIISKFISEIRKTLLEIKEDNTHKDNFIIQLIFIIHDQLLTADFYCFGQGNYPILEKPEYFDYNYDNEVTSKNNDLDYTKVSTKLFSFNSILENLEVDNYILETDFYQFLVESYKYKIYLLLNKAFEQITEEEINLINIKKPLYIYANEHDCPPINIYLFN
nr:hypothetical protein [uncultured Flavobacterium sp.]